MRTYRELIKEKFPQDEKNGLYVSPKLPAVKLGKILLSNKQIASPNDVIALHLFSGFLSGGQVILTEDRCYYPDGVFNLEDVKEVQAKGSTLVVFANQQTQLVPHEFKVKSDQVAKTVKRVLEAIARFDPKSEAAIKKTEKYAEYSTTELDWLNLRDEIMRTIDMLYERYNDGKLSMLEYESKKDDLLNRL
ncbi:MAG: hypothetical protein AAFN10_06145 [Bacteroidota bacterium]